MESENGRVFFASGLDNSELKSDASEAVDILHGVGDEVREQSLEIQEMLKNVPTPKVDLTTNIPTTIEEISAAFSNLDSVIAQNEAAIKKLEAEERRLNAEYSNTFQANQKEADAIRAQKEPITANIRLRKEILQSAKATQRELTNCVAKMREESKATQDNEKQQVSLRQRLRELKMELVEMEAAGQRNTAKYREMQEEAARLTDAWSDAQAQATILAHDQRGMQGIISGLSGIAGAASVAQGAIGLFGGENEHLQQIMLKVQSLMAITMGLQQVQQTLNKDSAFQLVTLNSLKELWNKLTGDSAEALEDENEAIESNIGAQEADAAATASDTDAQTANNTSTAAGTVAQTANTAATKTHTAATVAQTIATKAASLAMKGLKAAIISTGIGALIVLVGELVGWLMKLFESTSKADEEFKEQEEILSKGREAYAKASVEISNYREKLDKFNGSKEQEKQLVKELNSKYGEAMGYYKSLEEWKRVLKEKGEAYCDMLLKEAEAQALLNKYTEAFINLQEVRDKIAKGDYHHWYNTKAGDAKADKDAEAEAQAEADKWLKQYRETMEQAQQIRDNFDLNPHIDPSSVTSKSGSGKTFDPAKAALDTKNAIDEYKKKVSQYVQDANDEINALIISGQEQGLTRELNEIREGTRQKLAAWNRQLEQLAEARKASAKAQYMATKGASEVGWANSADGKKSIDDWIAVIKAETPQVIAEFDRVWQQITKNGNEAIQAAQQKYTDALIDEFGTAAQKEEKLTREWAEKLKYIPAEFQEQAFKQMEEQFARLGSEQFKVGINWESVFGNLSEQALPVLQFTLSKVKDYFEKNKGAMSTEDIKNYQEAIAKMEDEIANRNPFASLQKSIHDIGASKQELITALADMKTAQSELNAAILERNAAQEAYNDILQRVEAGELAQGSDEQTQAYKRLTDAKEGVTKATEKNNAAEQRVMNAQNKQTASYKRFATSLRGVGDTIGGLGDKAKAFAAVFDTDVANSIGKALDFMDEMIDATATVIDAIGDVGKNVAQGVETAVQSSAQGAQAAATTGAAAISTIEKASVILAIISAALQVATAIANLFNNDDAKQKEIDRLQERIDQLQWELDNQDIVRLQNNQGKAIDNIKIAIEQARRELRGEYEDIMRITNIWERMREVVVYNNTLMQTSAKKLADMYANMGYTVDKALGTEKFANTRSQLENIAQQQLLIQQQIEAEQDKKDSDSGKIEEWERKIEELGAEALQLINDLVEEIIGGSATDIANELADAFIDAFEAGEDAAEAWGKKVDEIVAGIVKKMLVTKFLEEPLGKLFDKYKARWFPNGDGSNTIDLVMGSMDEFTNDLNAIGAEFSAIFENLPDNLKSLFAGEDPTREAAEKGIAQASQDSVDELNGRATAIQGHTYQINENTAQLVLTSNRILQAVLNIDGNTDGLSTRMEAVETNVRQMRNTLDDLALKGIKIQR